MDRIRVAACRAFAENGFTSTRVADIANKAGVSSGIIHYYFRSKEQVLAAALQWAVAQSETAAVRIRSETPDHIERFGRLLDHVIPHEGVPRDEWILWLEVWNTVKQHPDLLDECVAASSRWSDFIAELIEEGEQAGVFAPLAPASEVAQRIVAMCEGLSFRCVVGYAGMEAPQVNVLLFRFAEQQLGLPNGALSVVHRESRV
jgi:AcrR family transcriptional regulator